MPTATPAIETAACTTFLPADMVESLKVIPKSGEMVRDSTRRGSLSAVCVAVAYNPEVDLYR